MRRVIVTVLLVLVLAGQAGAQPFEEIEPPPWVRGVTRMAFGTPGDVAKIADAGAQVMHTNLVWPYHPLRKDGGGLTPDDRARLRALVEACHQRGLKIVLGLPPFMPVELANQHPDWRIRPAPAPP